MPQTSFFSSIESKNQNNPSPSKPLAWSLRPQLLDQVVGQQHLIGPNKILRNIIENDQLTSIIFWGPPGCGKTTLAYIVASQTKAKFIPFSAVVSGIKEVKETMRQAQIRHKNTGYSSIIFIDEIHRFNKAQQDAFLPYIENGTIILIGATTQNPSFELNNALLSRCKVLVLEQLSTKNIQEIISRALKKLNQKVAIEIKISKDLLKNIAQYADGDARQAISVLDILHQQLKNSNKQSANIQDLQDVLQRKIIRHDKHGEDHYNLISALHKSMRDSDPDASLYWLGRMIEGGEDPLFIARRLIRFASEDVGLADPQALLQATAAKDAVNFIGLPEGSLALAQAVTYLALCPKSNSLYKAYQEVIKDVHKTHNEPVGLNMRNAPTKLMKKLGYSKGYKYAHENPEGFVKQQHLPQSLAKKTYYKPTSRGLERKLSARLEQIRGKIT